MLTHGRDDVGGAGRVHRDRLPAVGDAEAGQHRVLSGHGRVDRLGVVHVGPEDAQPLIVQGNDSGRRVTAVTR
ncbi:hypothetical protein GCM10025864_26930 [Luteimicrobium album]|uniref:Uncharacterized protein n=1 Tax=Luteimicrobium album TaxID=1054550 RepID=A0ABQ6I534_9MICO|nr:hypothetical protein GCM10025864_26930 [Luteimicrobium album]